LEKEIREVLPAILMMLFIQKGRLGAERFQTWMVDKGGYHTRFDPHQNLSIRPASMASLPVSSAAPAISPSSGVFEKHPLKLNNLMTQPYPHL
jgi:hypothetical protein